MANAENPFVSKFVTEKVKGKGGRVYKGAGFVYFYECEPNLLLYSSLSDHAKDFLFALEYLNRDQYQSCHRQKRERNEEGCQ